MCQHAAGVNGGEPARGAARQRGDFSDTAFFSRYMGVARQVNR
jgi:hypothetical protein